MRFSKAFVFAALAALVTAQNPFTMNTIPTTIPSGEQYNITWRPTTTGTVSLWLVNGPPQNVKFYSVIAANLTNSGAYVWTPPASIVSGPNYALKIVDDADNSINNFSGEFAISSPSISSATSTASVPTTTPTPTPSSGTKSSTATGSSSPSATSSTTESSTTESSNASSGTTTSGTTTSGTTTYGTTTYGTTTSGTTSKTSSTEKVTATSTAANASATQSKAAAAERPQAGIGLLAVLGAAVIAL